ncbi:efflux RND transporter periplasmic adaptor subunit [Metallumcola ferriviriculae]|uniref:Efflux RND transporter periplasmic adaptor subunit n=1 Tax=Metallumcola ferriviriculae TaxID=3039180 RepID=A0AAU0UMP1_9FIRM|nr:efflux RND transporter periplasmic adaptor subunit [Desulfitibacteraceae bacterium MK1]
MKKYLKYGLVLLLCIVFVGGIYAKSFSGQKDTIANAAQYATAEVQRGEIQVTAGGTGSIEASVRKEIATLSGGTVDKIYVQEGQFVEEGDLILIFENDTQNTVVERAKLNIIMAENKLKDLQEDLKSLKIYAPASGVVQDIDVNIGEQVSKGILTTIINKSKMQVIGKFNKSQINAIGVGDEAKILMLYNYQDVAGKVIKVGTAPTARDDGAVLYEVTFELDNPGGFTPGMETQITVKNDKGTYAAVENETLTTGEPYKVELDTGGTLIKLNVDSEDSVEEGQLIAEVENDDLRIQIDEQMIKVEEAKLELSEKLEDADNSAVYAPIAGTVTEIEVTEGESVRENTAVTVVSDLENLKVVIPIDELDISKVKVGQEASVSVEAVPDHRFKAAVAEVALEGKTSGGVATFDVTLSLNDNKGLRPGMTANAEIIASKKANALLLPIQAVQQRGNQRFVITGQPEQGRPQTTPIKIGLVSANYVEIAEGLSEGEQVLYQVVGQNNSQDQGPNIRMMGAGARLPGSWGSGGGRRPSGGGGG